MGSRVPNSLHVVTAGCNLASDLLKGGSNRRRGLEKSLPSHNTSNCKRPKVRENNSSDDEATGEAATSKPSASIPAGIASLIEERPLIWSEEPHP